LTRTAAVADVTGAGGELSLGGRLLYAGELDEPGRAGVIAGNVSGCATVAASADMSAQKNSIRDGVADFLVTSLDEALRILKNEVRQRKTVAVCVGAAPELVEAEMTERGVQPDLVFAGSPDHQRIVPKFGAGTLEIQFAAPDRGLAFVTWQVEQAPARWMPRLDAAALSCMDQNSWESRWVRLAPRYLGRSALAQRALFCNLRLAKEILQRFAELVQSGEIGAEVSTVIDSGDETMTFRMRPGETAQRSF
jgi:urocanate hydratase